MGSMSPFGFSESVEQFPSSNEIVRPKSKDNDSSRVRKYRTYKVTSIRGNPTQQFYLTNLSAGYVTIFNINKHDVLRFLLA